jgi:hypothetical protein
VKAVRSYQGRSFEVFVAQVSNDDGKPRTVQWLLHRRMGANQQMRRSPRGAHLMLKVRTLVVNGTFNKNLAAAERWARRPFHKAA